MIDVNNLSKSYKLYDNPQDRLKEALNPFKKKYHHEFYALKNISFSVNKGDVFGFMGENGAGKSTLLKIITGVLTPTAGTLRIQGKIASLLELGAGFNAEMSGYDNIYLNGNIMGYSKKQIDAKVHDIINFAEIGEYIHQSVKTYSSGMFARLAFSVAINVEPDILIVDEVLSVGDAYFQHKSFARIEQMRKNGCTILFVSHDAGAIHKLCNRVMLLKNGEIVKIGDPQSIVSYYNAMLAQKSEEMPVIEQTSHKNGTTTKHGTGEAVCTNISLYNSAKQSTQKVAVGEDIEFCLEIEIKQTIDALVVGFGVCDKYGQMVFGTNTWHTKQKIDNPEIGKYQCGVRFKANLAQGSYSLTYALSSTETHLVNDYEWRDNTFIFEVINIDKYFFVGCVWNEMNFSINKVFPLSHGVSREKLGGATPDRNLIMVDVGCRWGFVDMLIDKIEHFKLYGFDPDVQECERLQAHYKNHRIEFIPMALLDKQKNITLYVTKQPACSSIYEPNIALTQNCSVVREELEKVKEVDIQTTTLDIWAKQYDIKYIDYLKIDTQGSELLILQGAKDILKSIRVIKVEVQFNPIYNEVPLFCDVDKYLRENGFVLWKLTDMCHYSWDQENTLYIEKNHIKFNEITQSYNQLGGQIYWADAHYVNSQIFQTQPIKDEKQLKRDIFLFNTLGHQDISQRLKKQLDSNEI